MSVVVCIGNAYRRDDGVGLAVAERLSERVPADVAVLTSEQEPSRLLDLWEGATLAVVVDAACSGGEPGTVHRIDAAAEPVPAGIHRSSTHAFGVGDAVELARALGRLPPRVVVLGIEGAEFTAGEGLSAAVEGAVEHAVELVLEELAAVAGRAA
jgi:hydrogenase maturation protease